MFAAMATLWRKGRGLPISMLPPPRLAVSGPYRYMRHPIYLGWVLMVFGAPTMTMGRVLFATISAAYLVVAIPIEERSLVKEFGQSYRDYQRQVQWRLLPGIW
jgi:protein-S-isoprenylcysteine O-methyltransferase Ste14